MTSLARPKNKTGWRLAEDHPLFSTVKFFAKKPL
jgi:hypothetical protein